MKTQLALLLVITACGKKDDAAPTAAPAPTAAAKPTEAPAALADIDLSKAGADWKGFHVKGMPGADVSDNGAGGVVINFKDNTMVQLVPAEPDTLKNFKQGMAANYKSITYSVDSPDELVFTAVSDMGGNLINGYGIQTIVSAGGKKVSCGSSYDDEATAKRMREVCKSLAK